MKTNKIFAIMALALMGLVAPTKLKAQTTAEVDGRCVKFDVKASGLPSDQDQREILGWIDSSKIVSGELYKTSRGAKFYVNNPSSLKELYYTSATEALGYRPSSLMDAYNKSVEIICGDDVNFIADNYFIAKDGKVGTAKLNLFKTSIRIRMLNGKPWYKIGDNGCFNVLRVPVAAIATKPNVPSAVPPPVVYVPAPRVDTIYRQVQQVQQGCPCSTYVACTNCFESYPVSSVSGISFNQYYQLNSMSHGQLPTSSNDRYGSFHGAYGNMYTSIGQTPGYQNAVYSATSGQHVVWAYAGYSSPQCCVQQVAVNPCPCGQAIQPCPCAQQPAPAPAPASTVKPKRRCGGWIVAGVIATGVIVYAILTGKKTNQLDSGGPGTQGGVLPTGGPGTQDGGQ